MEFRDTAKDFLGVGWHFPISVDPVTGRMREVSSEEDIAQAVRIILKTALGERMMQPNFGCALPKFVFGHMDYTTRVELEREVLSALIRWEPRVTQLQVSLSTDPKDSACLLLHVAYVVRSTNNPYNLVYPYYLTEGLEG